MAEIGEGQTSVTHMLGKDKLSLTGKRWLLKDADERQALAISQRLNVPEILGRVLADRGLDVEQAPDFLEPKLKTQLPNPLHLKDMTRPLNVCAKPFRPKKTLQFLAIMMWMARPLRRS